MHLNATRSDNLRVLEVILQLFKSITFHLSSSIPLHKCII